MKWPENYELCLTADGSPTLAQKRSDGYVEKMHYSAGALSESVFIYGHALATVLNNGWPVRILSFGLGLGYNELLSIAQLLKTSDDAPSPNFNSGTWQIWSFEADPFLRDSFAQWLTRTSTKSVYNTIATSIANHYGLAAEDLHAAAADGFQQGSLQLRGAYPQNSDGVTDCTCVYYDAFSKKMQPDPWEQSNLEKFLSPHLAKTCVFSTYAALGSTKRALKAMGFRLCKRPGFDKKRESTFAIRS